VSETGTINNPKTGGEKSVKTNVKKQVGTATIRIKGDNIDPTKCVAKRNGANVNIEYNK